ncbi:Required for respiratory growth protein 9 mitochondrial [Lambiella insularis]|nr:Required for respiratory growth protein 9 mitochondrial [Lambiella insularis]
MSCSACRSDTLCSLFFAFGFRPFQVPLRPPPRSLQQRHLHAGSVFGISSSLPRSLDLVVRGGDPQFDLEGDFIPFRKNFVPSTSERVPSESPISSKSHDRHLPAVINRSTHKRKDIIHKGADVREETRYDRQEIPWEVTASDTCESTELKYSSTKLRPRKPTPRVTRTNIARTSTLEGSSTNTRPQNATNRVKPQIISTAKRTKPVTPQEPWGIQKTALEEKFGEKGWVPRKRLSPDALEGIRALHAQYPQDFSTSALADQFKVSPEAIRRILKSKWRPNEDEDVSRRKRWEKRGETIWNQMAQLGVRPPKKWREIGVGSLGEAQNARQQPRSQSRHVKSRDEAEAAPDDSVEAPVSAAEDDSNLVGRSLSDRIL